MSQYIKPKLAEQLIKQGLMDERGIAFMGTATITGQRTLGAQLSGIAEGREEVVVALNGTTVVVSRVANGMFGPKLDYKPFKFDGTQVERGDVATSDTGFKAITSVLKTGETIRFSANKGSEPALDKVANELKLSGPANGS